MPVGRPRNFDTGHALSVAMLVFWELGYEGASLERLRTSMGIAHMPSLFKAFGDKERLFQSATELYWDTYYVPLLAELESLPNVEEAFEFLLKSLAHLYTAHAPMRGCLIVTGATNCTPQNAALVTWTAQYRDRIQNAIHGRLARAVSEEQISSLLLSIFTEFYGTLIIGMAMRARDNATTDMLLSTVSLAIEPLEVDI
ncbi:TetR/AcrR family transcriptional regulator [Methylobacterium sp. SD274]|uniref:TetR/AcrR family transcriptional regulator n=1 Tax=Methylobacterium sp. SD274 TaxID=2782009 RepID=UPI001A9686AB|nr:TetR/AcrR family transcriptional regulator [Methylobacterium sp. SD274]MBO1022696.1 TetR/AcrR family transcriptional regulator [Methylobacterium sp. SD274]